MNKIRGFLKDDSGAAAVEYAILVSVVVIIAATALNAFGPKLKTKFETLI